MRAESPVDIGTARISDNNLGEQAPKDLPTSISGERGIKGARHGELGQESLGPFNRSSEQLGKEKCERQEVHRIVAWVHLFTVHIHEVAHHPQGVEADAHWDKHHQYVGSRTHTKSGKSIAYRGEET